MSGLFSIRGVVVKCIMGNNAITQLVAELHSQICMCSTFNREDDFYCCLQF